MGAALKLFRDDEPPRDESAFALQSAPGGLSPRSTESPLTKRPWPQLCAELVHRANSEPGASATGAWPSDVWLTADGCEALLRLCRVETFGWMLQRFPPEKIVLACTYALWMQQEKKLKAKTPGPLVNRLLVGGSQIDDRRPAVLPGAETFIRRCAGIKS